VLNSDGTVPDSWTPGAIAALRERLNLPFVRADSQGLVVEFNPRFAEVYGWDERLIGQSVGEILPAQFRELHHSGFARFQITEQSKVVNHPLTLATICCNGTEIQSEHFIVAEKSVEHGWCFAATLRPLEGPHAQEDHP
jgi:PAS domain S-box-containing protein